MPFMRVMEIKSWIACVGTWVGMFILRALFIFSHARILVGLFIVPGRETEKLNIVPLDY